MLVHWKIKYSKVKFTMEKINRGVCLGVGGGEIKYTDREIALFRGKNILYGETIGK